MHRMALAASAAFLALEITSESSHHFVHRPVLPNAFSCSRSSPVSASTLCLGSKDETVEVARVVRRPSCSATSEVDTDMGLLQVQSHAFNSCMSKA